MRSKISKYITAVFLALCVVIPVFSTSVFASDSETSSPAIDKCENIVEEYDAKTVAAYLAGDNTYPRKDGYVFGGWYTEKACDKTCMLQGKAPSGTTYALFVPEHVLSVKAQISATMLDTNVTNDATASIRFVTTVDSLLYQQVGFEVSYVTSSGVIKKATSVSKEVYKKLYIAGTTEAWSVTPQEEFCNQSVYFKACTITNVPVDNYSTKFTVKPFWVTMDGDKVYGKTVIKSIEDGCLRDEVWVTSNTDSSGNATGQDILYYGSYDYPYATLDYAISRVNDGGKVHVRDNLSVAADAEWTEHNKSVIITGDGTDDSTEDGKETLNFSAIENLYVNDGVTFRDLKLQLSDYVFANGNSLTVESGVTLTNDANTVTIYGGGRGSDVASTDLELNAGSYLVIYGGCYNGDVTGETCVVIGEGVNPGVSYESDSQKYMLFGGCNYKGTVYGDTNVTVGTDSKFDYIYGGGRQADTEVKGTTHVTFNGLAYSIYGGSRSGTNADTQVVMESGVVYQIFGGCEENSMTGNTDVQVLGGKVYRRIYGGCYNDYGTFSGWSDILNQVTGYTSVVIGADAEASLDTGTETGLLAVSRYKSTFSNECGVLIFNDDMYSNTTWKLSSEIGSNLFGDNQAYHYLVQASTGGEVYSAGNCLYIEPDKETGKKATVRLDSNSGAVVYYAEEAGYYPLPELISSKREIYVTFDETVQTDFVGSAEAKISIGNNLYAYYETLKQAIVAAEKMTNATVEDLKTDEKLATITVVKNDNGTVTSSCKNCIAGGTVTIEVAPNKGYVCTALNVKKDGTAITLSEEVASSGGTYRFVAEEGNYTVEAEFQAQFGTVYGVINGASSGSVTATETTTGDVYVFTDELMADGYYEISLPYGTYKLYFDCGTAEGMIPEVVVAGDEPIEQNLNKTYQKLTYEHMVAPDKEKTPKESSVLIDNGVYYLGAAGYGNNYSVAYFNNDESVNDFLISTRIQNVSGEVGVMMYGYDDTTSPDVMIRLNSSGLRLYGWGISWPDAANSFDAIDSDFVLTVYRKGATIRIYIDGNLIHTYTNDNVNTNTNSTQSYKDMDLSKLTDLRVGLAIRGTTGATYSDYCMLTNAEEIAAFLAKHLNVEYGEDDLPFVPVR